MTDPFVDNLTDSESPNASNPSQQAATLDPQSEPDLLPEPLPQRPRSLLQRVLKGTMWTVGGHFFSQGIRLVNNIILSRLLFPEAFGLMALVFTFMAGLQMFSDTGTNANIIQSKRGEDRIFLNTAWTVECIRGIILWLAACLISYPVSTFYREPILLYLLPAVSLSMLILGFSSNKLAIASRNLNLGKLTTIDLTTQLISITITLLCALGVKLIGAPKEIAIWSLVIGNISGAICQVILSHKFLPGEGNRFALDRDALRELFQFGRWIFLSTLLTFFALQGNNLVIPRLMGVGFFGIFSFAYNLSQLGTNVVNMVGSRVLFPSFAELNREHPERLYPALRRARFAMNGLNWAVSFVFIIFGQQLINVMYDDRYADAGWMLRILALGSLVSMLAPTYGNVLLAQGKAYVLTMMMVLQIIFQFTGLFLGYYLGGELGLIVGTALASWALYPLQAIFYARLSIWQPEVDLPVIAIAIGVAAVFFSV